MNARKIIEEAMPGLTDREQAIIGRKMMAFLTALKQDEIGQSHTLFAGSPAEAAYIAHVAQGNCMAQMGPATPHEGKTLYPVRLTKHRQDTADISAWGNAKPALRPNLLAPSHHSATAHHPRVPHHSYFV